MDKLMVKGRAVQVIEPALGELVRSVAGECLSAGHPEYEGARRIWNGLIDKRPGIIVRCRQETDVIAAVNFARDHKVELAVRGGGHNVAGRAISEGGLVIDLSPMRRVEVDEAERTVTVEGGGTLGDVDRATHPRGLAVPLGAVSKTGVAGLTLHGGYGWLTRRFGLSIDNLLAARVVTSAGEVVRASADENPDLFWAIRGGGGNFGVVTSFTFRSHAIGPTVWFSLVFYPLEQGVAVTRIFRDYMATAPDELMSIAIYWSAPALPEIPAALQGAPVLIVASVYSGPPEQGERVLGPLRQAAEPIADLTTQMPFGEVQRAFDEDYPDGRLYYWKSGYVAEVSEELLALMATHAGRRPSPLSTVELWGLSGAVRRVPAGATAFAHRDAPFLITTEANWDDASSTASNIDWAREAARDVQRFSAGRAYLNFSGLDEDGEALVRGAYGANYERLRRVKANLDPENLFRGNFNIAPLGS